jgi:5-formyltetrahydrofolate cyclo-ligase
MPDDLAAEKRRLRRLLEARRRAIGAAAAHTASSAAAEHLLRNAAVRAASRVALYAALPGELSMRALFEGLGARGVTRLLPRIRRDRIEFAEVESWSELEPGVFDVLEPPDTRPECPLRSDDVAVVPGLAFDAQGNRLGHGKGYYDQAFSGERSSLPKVIGACFAVQVIPHVPHDSRDRRMDAIVTELGLRWMTGST